MFLIRFLIIAICVLYIVRSLARMFLPMLFQGMVNKAQQQQFNRQQQYRQQEPKRSEERVKVDYVPPAPKSSIPDNEGDFIDYEEVK